jgi:hypothetical protein
MIFSWKQIPFVNADASETEHGQQPEPSLCRVNRILQRFPRGSHRLKMGLDLRQDGILHRLAPQQFPNDYQLGMRESIQDQWDSHK